MGGGRFNLLRRLGLFLLAVLPAAAQPAPNLLKDAGFEGSMGNSEFSQSWTRFGRAFCDNVTPRTKVFVAKLFGQFDGKVNYSGVYQDIPAQPGKRYVASAYLRQNTGDVLEGENTAWIKLEFFDAKFNQLKAVESPVRLHAKSASNRWLFYTTGPCTAPPGTVWARFVALFEQQADAMGAALFDDIELKELQ